MPIPSRENLYNRANLLAILTIFFNLAEGLVSVWLGVSDETLTLFAFGVDSFVEVISAVGVWHMVRRLRQSPDNEDSDRFEKQALRITGVAFCLLAAGLIMTASWNIYHQHKPETTFWGIVVGAVSIICMGILVHYKGNTGRQLGSGAILADAACSRVCMYLGIVLMLASIGYELTGVGLLDSVGSIVIALFSIKEGKEALQKANGLSCCCGRTCRQPGIGQTIPSVIRNKE
ncbi:MAG: cation transporter [Deltaproteobacteria bacterium]|nr:cation transporter [Deltaproteobacteria bacterium]